MHPDAIEFAETGHWWREPHDLPVRLLNVLHAGLEGVKLIELIASVQHSFLFWSSLARRAVADLLVSVPLESQ